ncbi:hypothetical protein ACFQWH_08810 [Mycolicibacterium sp. GCM10028919]|uniref:hypothetical protein n=1 Tax=Mycolicibacterium sp. GCM10028919 TaxID=3273401 RepID=UPI003613EA37
MIDMALSRRALMRGLVQAAAAGMSLLGTRTLPPKAETTVPTFYVSASGSDEADGLTQDTAWATIQKANSALPVGRAAVLFRRGDTFYGELTPPFGCEVGAFGAGVRPVLTMFKLLNRPEGWIEVSTGIWKINLGSPDSHDGYTVTSDANIGYLMVDDVVKPALKYALTELTEPWDFCCDLDDSSLFVKALANPATLAQDVKAAPNGDFRRVIFCDKGSNNVHDVHVTGTGGCGIGGTGPDVWIHDCRIDYIGGSELLDGTRRRYGNGIDNWVNVKRWTIEQNEITQVYDVAWSPQGPAGATGFWDDMTFRNNYVHDCTQMVEFWSTGDPSAPGFRRIRVYQNIFERAGYSVFSDVRPDQDKRVHLLSYNLQTPVDVLIEDNVFDGASGAYSFHVYGPPAGYVSRNNTIRLRAGTRMQFQLPETVEQAEEWRVATGREQGSIFEIVTEY